MTIRTITVPVKDLEAATALSTDGNRFGLFSGPA
jgi:hypothetical protein